MRKQLKYIGDKLIGMFNFKVARVLNGIKIKVPIINGVKVGVSSEKWMSGLLRELFQITNGIFYDIGANLGQTLIKVKTLDADREYIGFEPNPSCLFYLNKLINSNHWNNVRLIPAGLSNMDGLVELTGSSDTDPGSTIIESLIPTSPRVTKLVPVFNHSTISNILPDNIVTIVKIDVEGAELEVIQTMSSLLEKDQPVVVMEILPVTSDESQGTVRREQLLGLLRELKYIPYRICKSKSEGYTGITRLESFGTSTDPVYKDHVFIPMKKQRTLENRMTIVPTPIV